MRIAITYDPETGMVAEHFGHAEYFKLYTEDDGVVFTDVVASPANGHSGVTAFLASQGVDVVICDRLGEEARDALFAVGIAAFPGAYAPADELAVALLENRLIYEPDTSCGCHGDGGCSCSCDEGCNCGDGCGCHE